MTLLTNSLPYLEHTLVPVVEVGPGEYKQWRWCEMGVEVGEVGVEVGVEVGEVGVDPVEVGVALVEVSQC